MRHPICAGVLDIGLDIGLDNGITDNLAHVAECALRGAVALSRSLAAALEDQTGAGADPQAPSIGSAADAARGIAILIEPGQAASGEAVQSRRAERAAADARLRKADARARGVHRRGGVPTLWTVRAAVLAEVRNDGRIL